MKTSYSHLLLFSTLCWVGAHRVNANEEPSCGFPPFNKRKDRGIFVFKKCFSNQWYFRVIGGRQPLTVTGTLEGDKSKVQVKDAALNTEFVVDVKKKQLDGFNFNVKDEGKACLTINSSGDEDIPLYVGKNKVKFAKKSISFPSLKPCDGPLLEYRFDSSRTLFKDTGELGWDGTTAPGRGRISYTSLGYSRYAASLDGRDDHMLIPQSKNLNMKMYTMMAWVRYSDTSRKDDRAYAIVQKASAVWFNINRETHTVRAGGFFGGCSSKNLFQLKGTTKLPTESWTHIAAINDGVTLKVYINGELEVEGKFPDSAEYCANQAPFNVGSGFGETREQDKNFFRGYMDTVRVYDEPLSQDELRSEMFRV